MNASCSTSILLLSVVLLASGCSPTPAAAQPGPSPAQPSHHVPSTPVQAEPADPKPGEACVSSSSCPNLDWSFLGPENRDVRSRHVLKLRPVVIGAGIAAEELTPEGQVAANHGAVTDWVRFHHEAAQAGAASVVRLVLEHCVGWGSETPSSYTMHGCFSDRAVFIQPVGNSAFEAQCARCMETQDGDCRTRHCEPPVLVEGRFVGKTRTVMMDPEDPDTRRDAYELEVFRHKVVDPRAGEVSQDTIHPLIEVCLPAGSPMPTESLPPGRRFAVVHVAEPLWQPASLSAAKDVAQRFTQAGSDGVVVVDSRLIPSLWCCGFAVVSRPVRHAPASRPGCSSLERERDRNGSGRRSRVLNGTRLCVVSQKL